MARPKTKTAYESRKAYTDKNYDQVLLMLPKGAREQIKQAASAQGVSMNRYILDAVEQKSGLKLTLDNTLPWVNPETKK